MMDFAIPVLFTLFAWWFSTGAILYLDGLPRRTFRYSLAGATLLLVASLYGLAVTASDASLRGVYLAFACGLMVWGWQEMAFLMGVLTGPRRSPSPPGSGLGRRFVDAVMAILYHELAIIAGAVAIITVTWGGENQFGLWTYLLLWMMRLSAKLNLFLGVPNLAEEFLPDHLKYLEAYFRRAPMNMLFPLSITGGTIATVLLFQAASAPDATDATVAGFTFLGTMAALAVLEHWFMVLPIPSILLWAWSLRSREQPHAPSWTMPLAEPCDPHELRDVLAAAANGAYGKVERLSGTVRAGSGWVEFYAAAGTATITACPARDQAQATITGGGLDRARLQAAFAACALPSATLAMPSAG